ncbi:MAG TPA: hypothetical protein VLX91_01865 [Candidatus Acidoferrales bacterium]|nr:hypothetical protein [Candidatus Acidoferrales bacterium]
MIGMDFVSFLVLLVISVIVSLILYYALKLRIRTGFASLLGTIVWGWIGAWLGSPIFGYWFPGWNYHDVYVVPAILGAFALVILMVDLVKTIRTIS